MNFGEVVKAGIMGAVEPEVRPIVQKYFIGGIALGFAICFFLLYLPCKKRCNYLRRR